MKLFLRWPISFRPLFVMFNEAVSSLANLIQTAFLGMLKHNRKRVIGEDKFNEERMPNPSDLFFLERAWLLKSKSTGHVE